MGCVSSVDEPHQPPETPNNAGWATFEARVRARRLAACVERAGNLIDGGQLAEARESINEATLLAPDAPEIAELEQKIHARPSPGAVLLATADTPLAIEDSEPSREWPRVLAAITVVLAVFFFAGYGLVRYRHQLAIPDFLSTESLAPARDATVETRQAAAPPEPVPPVPETQAPLDNQATPAPPANVDERPASPAAQPESQPQPERESSQPVRSIAPSASAAPAVAQTRPLLLPEVPAERKLPNPPDPTAIPQVRPLAETRPVEAVALEMTSPTPTATTGAQPMATLDAPVPASPPAGSGESRHDESLRIRAVLLRYENAYNRLDAKAARTVWPGVNEAALSRAFSGLVSQKVSLGLCDITVFGDVAGASCAGKARWEPKVGGGLQTADRYWTFQLTKNAEGWNIKEVLVR